jgi:cation transport ATPase
MSETQSVNKKEESKENLEVEKKSLKQKQKKSFDVDLGISISEIEKILEDNPGITKEAMEETKEIADADLDIGDGIGRTVRRVKRQRQQRSLPQLKKREKEDSSSSSKPARSNMKSNKRQSPKPSQSPRPSVRYSEGRKGPSFNLPFLKERGRESLRMIYFVLTNQGLRLGVGGFLFTLAILADATGDYDPEIIYVLFFIPYVIFSLPVLLKLLINLGRRKLFDENLLILLATMGAFYIDMYWESVGVLLMYQVARLAESIVLSKTRKSVAENIDIKSQTANLKRGNTIEVVQPETLKIRQTIVIKPGEKIPVDAVVTSGKSMVDTKALTGEAEPVEVKIGYKIFSGCIN